MKEQKGFLNFVKQLFSRNSKDKNKEPPQASSLWNQKEGQAWRCNVCLALMFEEEERFHHLQIAQFDLCPSCFENFVVQKQPPRDGLQEMVTLAQGYEYDWKNSTSISAYITTQEEPSYCREYFSSQNLKRVHVQQPNNTCSHTILYSLQTYHHRPLFGYCITLPQTEKRLYHWISYYEIMHRLLYIVKGLQQSISTQLGELVGICGKNSMEWFLMDFASMFLGLVTVPIHFSMTKDEYIDILQDTQCKVLLCSAEMMPHFLNLKKENPSLPFHTIVVWSISEEMLQKNQQQTLVTLFSLYSIMNTGKPIVQEFCKQRELHLIPKQEIASFCIIQRDPKDLLTIVYTSGSTGKPKGSCLSDATYHHAISQWYRYDPLITFSYSPLAHLSDRQNVTLALCNGGRMGIFQNDMSVIFEELSILRPTDLVSTPRLYNVLYNEYLAEYQHLTESMNDEKSQKEVESQLMNKYRNIFGTRLQIITTGGAPTSKAVKTFLRDCFKCIINDGYGASEVGGICNDGSLRNDAEYKLCSVPEMNYLITDTPFPRGELCVKTPSMFSGYYGSNKQLTESVLDSDGFYHTGDIVEEISSRRIRIIDRKKNIFKLAQGEFVAPEKLEIVYLESPFVEQIFIYGNTNRSFVLAVVVPNEIVLKQHFNTEDVFSFAKMNEKEMQQFFIKEFTTLAAKKQLQGYEIPRGILLEKVPFSMENKLLTTSFKLNRMGLDLHYKAQLEELYEQLEHHKEDLLEQLFSAKEGLQIVDSLQAVRLSNILKQEYHIDISASIVMNQQFTSRESFLEWIQLNKTTKLNSKPLSQEELQYEKQQAKEYIIDSHLAKSNSSIVLSQHEKQCIILTGSTGFLGSYLLIDLLLTSHPQSIIYCIVRASDLETAIAKQISSLQSRYLWNEQTETLFHTKVKIILGDLQLPNLGIDSIDLYQELASTVDLIYHNAAHVNALLSYEKLKQANVTSTLELIKLATHCKLKPIHFISTISVLQGVENGSEQSSSNTLLLQGYALSKWIAEENLKYAASTIGLPITIYRPAMIGACEKTGVSNEIDWVTRLFKGTLALQSKIPKSNRNLQLTPVNVVSRLIISISTKQSCYKQVYFHIFNPSALMNMTQVLETLLHDYKYQIIPYAEWKQYLKQQSDQHFGAVWPLVELFASNYSNDFGRTITEEVTCKETIQFCQDNGIPMEYSPSLSKEYLLQIGDWIQKNLIK